MGAETDPLKLEEELPPAANPGDEARAIEEAARRAASGTPDAGPSAVQTPAGAGPDAGGAAPGAAPAGPESIAQRKMAVWRSIDATAPKEMRDKDGKATFTPRELECLATAKRELKKDPCGDSPPYCIACQRCKKRLQDRGSDWKRTEKERRYKEFEAAAGEVKETNAEAAVLAAKGVEPYVSWNRAVEFTEGAAAFVGYELKVPKAAKFTAEEIAELKEDTRKVMLGHPAFAKWLLTAGGDEAGLVITLGIVLGRKWKAIKVEMNAAADEAGKEKEKAA